MRTMISAALLLAIGLPMQAQATNWLQVQGNEAPNAPAIRLSGFVQPTYTYIDANQVTGLRGAAAANNGKFSALNLNWPQLKSNHQFQFMRAAANVRGKLTDDINYLVAIEAGQNGTTYYRDPVLTDASITFNYIPGARVRAGLFKVPTGEEALLTVNTSYPYVYNSNATLYLLVGFPMTANASINPSGTTPATLASGFSGFRDWGIQVYDWFNKGPLELSYAAMVSNGGAIENILDSDSHKDLTLRLQASHIFAGSGPNREDFSVFMWQQDGKRRFGTHDFDQNRSGIGLKYLQENRRVSAEYIQADGMIVGGQTPPFVGNPLAVGVNEKANGWYLEGGWRFHPQWELDLRYDYLDFMTQTAANEREFATTTFGIQRFFDKNARLTFNYEWRDMKVSNAGAIPAGAPLSNAQTIAGNLGNRVSIQLTWSF
jgi:hypothetical protein